MTQLTLYFVTRDCNARASSDRLELFLDTFNVICPTNVKAMYESVCCFLDVLNLIGELRSRENLWFLTNSF